MKAIRIFILLMIGIATVTIAQEADSIVVTYDNQRTIIPVPSFGKQTTVKMADSVQMIEIGVSRRKISDFVQANTISSTTAASGKPLKKTKWYSQIEAGYTIKFISGPSSESININSVPETIYYNKDSQQGYKLGISIFEKERSITDKFSYVSGFKLGFAQSFRKAKDYDFPAPQDSVSHGYVGYVGYDPVTTSRIQFLFPFGFRQCIGSGKSDSRITFGSNIGSSINLIKMKDFNGYYFGGSPLILQPFLGFEKGKLGILITADLPFESTANLSTRQTVLKIDDGIGFSLTYRLF